MSEQSLQLEISNDILKIIANKLVSVVVGHGSDCGINENIKKRKFQFYN